MYFHLEHLDHVYKRKNANINSGKFSYSVKTLLVHRPKVPTSKGVRNQYSVKWARGYPGVRTVELSVE